MKSLKLEWGIVDWIFVSTGKIGIENKQTNKKKKMK